MICYLPNTNTKGSLQASSQKYLHKAQECEESQRECLEPTGGLLSVYTLVGLYDLISLPFTLFPFNQTKGITLQTHYEAEI